MAWDTDSLLGSEIRRFIAVLSLWGDLEDVCHHGAWLEAESCAKVSPGGGRGLSIDHQTLAMSAPYIRLETYLLLAQGRSPQAYREGVRYATTTDHRN